MGYISTANYLKGVKRLQNIEERFEHEKEKNTK